MRAMDRIATGDPTIGDVAAAAGVSIRTVSRVLNDSPKVNAATRERVRAAIAALDFRPSLRGRALATGRSYLLGIVHSDRNALVLDSVQRGVGREATRRGYEVVSHSVALEPRIDPVADVLAFARRARVDGVILLPPVADLPDLAPALRDAGVPAVALSSVPIDGYGAVILSQERRAAADVAAHLLALGHRRIAMVTGPANTRSAAERRAGFIEGLASGGVTLMAEREGDYGLPSGLSAGRSLLAAADRPTAIFAANDVMAAGLLKAAHEQGIGVPDCLSIVGFDGSLLADMLIPSLTTVERPFGAMAEGAARLLADLIEARPLSPLDIPPLRLRIAESTRSVS